MSLQYERRLILRPTAAVFVDNDISRVILPIGQLTIRRKGSTPIGYRLCVSGAVRDGTEQFKPMEYNSWGQFFQHSFYLLPFFIKHAHPAQPDVRTYILEGDLFFEQRRIQRLQFLRQI